MPDVITPPIIGAASSHSAVTNYAWTYDDGGFADVQNPTKTLPSPGTHHVHLTAEDGASNAVTTTIVISVAPPPFQIKSVGIQRSNVRLDWDKRGGESYRVQAAPNLSENTSTQFTDISPLFAAPQGAASVTDYVDAGSLSNHSTRYYRIRPGP
jgi:PKD repeat protein